MKEGNKFFNPTGKPEAARKQAKRGRTAPDPGSIGRRAPLSKLGKGKDAAPEKTADFFDKMTLRRPDGQAMVAQFAVAIVGGYAQQMGAAEIVQYKKEIVAAARELAEEVLVQSK